MPPRAREGGDAEGGWQGAEVLSDARVVPLRLRYTGATSALLMDLSMGALVEVDPDRATWTGDHRRATTRALDHLQ